MRLTCTGVEEGRLGQPPSMLQPIQDLIVIGSFGLPLLTSSSMKTSWMFVPSRIEILLLSTSGKGTCCRCDHCPTDLVTFVCFRGIVRSFTAQADLTSIRWSFPLSTEAIWKSTLRPSSYASTLFMVVSDSLLDEPLMFSSFTRDGSIMVMSEPESSRPKVVIWLPDLLITRTGIT